MIDKMGLLNKNHTYFMELAYREAEKAYEAGEIPVGAIVVSDETIIGKGYNQREMLRDPTAHAEMLAISSAADYLGNWRLEECTLYVTLEPCPMCAGAILNARIPRVIFGAYDDETGMCGSVDNLCDHNLMNHKTTVIGGVMENKCENILKSFFNNIRQRNRD